MAEKEIKSCSEGCEEMTDNEVIKALEVCAYSDVCLKECPLFNYKADCIKRLTASALEIIKRYQSDVAPVVRCKDCKNAWHSFEGLRCCIWATSEENCETEPDAFCSFGERKDNGND